ncbi:MULTISPECIES: tripartite tricarboxylate transporter TctB family protein [unclassified Rhizobium]|uniref:tripartite tricarboxylate transporter TctB family protein n=1 Tax=unclassified Rhizobium TaxID=2613769 RepID=UPI0017852503|nr:MULTISPECIES: tripartite tricarboxylate transporter TctB family protein [unclassified Rhizobium]MBD8688218.1 tripartite tricarboxylate transporter TctB family protein [Rhizobium sp. CFBP 13644]MBD8692673.1 tripartite tricarboxylate transporter TctB family protein [Rhizobium sp. CFBP 13717]
MTQDRFLGVAALALAAFMIANGYNLQAPFAYEPVGPRAFPLMAAGVTAICGLLLVLKPGQADTTDGSGISRPILVLAVCLMSYALLFQPLGFVLSTTVMMVPIAMVFGALWWQGAITGVLLAVSSYLLFDKVLDVILPVGPLGGMI